jgi:hypothetical protein
MDRYFRKSYIIFLLFSLCSLTLCAGSDEECFLRGNKLYENQEYKDALSSYEMVNKKGRAVLYNMGNCYYHLCDYPRAFLYWSRSERGALLSEIACARYNKQHVLEKLGRKKEEGFCARVLHFYDAVLIYFSLLALQILFLISWCMFLFVFYRNGRSKKLITVMLLLVVLFIGFGLRRCLVKQSVKIGVVMKEKASLFAGPDNKFHVVCPLATVDCVEIKEEREGWYKVGYSGNIGWIEADVIQII